MHKCTAMKRHTCLSCGAPLTEPLFQISNMPSGAQAMPTEETLAEDAGIDLALCGCPECGLVQFACDPVKYYRTAIRVVGLSETMRELRRADFRLLTERYGLAGKKWLECGCGNGDFLQILSEFDVDIYGTEWGREELREAGRKLCSPNGKTDESHLMHFFPERGDEEIPGAPFDVFLSFNFLEHQIDPCSMLLCLHKNLAEGGIGLITVPSFEYILQEGRYYELIRDHIANYDMDSLEHLCRRCGFEILEKGLIGIGDTLRFVVRKARGCKETGNGMEALSNSIKQDCREAFTDRAGALEKFQEVRVLKEDYEELNAKISAYLAELSRKKKYPALWGAGHQGFTIASTTELGARAKYFIDSSDKKQGNYAPASHLKIVSPEFALEDRPEVILITAPGYAAEIEKNIRQRYREAGAEVPEICRLQDISAL